MNTHGTRRGTIISAAEESGSDMAGSGAAKVAGPDWVVIGAGLLAYIASYLPWYRANLSILGIDRHTGVNAWNAGFGAWFSVLLLVVVAGVVITSTVGGRQLSTPTSRPLITLVGSALAFITIVLRWVTLPDASGGLNGHLGELGDFDLGSAFMVSSGAGSGLYLGLIAALVAVVASLLTFRTATRNVDHSNTDTGQHDTGQSG